MPTTGIENRLARLARLEIDDRMVRELGPALAGIALRSVHERKLRTHSRVPIESYDDDSYGCYDDIDTWSDYND